MTSFVYILLVCLCFTLRVVFYGYINMVNRFLTNNKTFYFLLFLAVSYSFVPKYSYILQLVLRK